METGNERERKDVTLQIKVTRGKQVVLTKELPDPRTQVVEEFNENWSKFGLKAEKV